MSAPIEEFSVYMFSKERFVSASPKMKTVPRLKYYSHKNGVGGAGGGGVANRGSDSRCGLFRGQRDGGSCPLFRKYYRHGAAMKWSALIITTCLV